MQAAYSKHLLEHAKENKQKFLSSHSKKPFKLERSSLQEVDDWVGVDKEFPVSSYEALHPDSDEPVCSLCCEQLKKSWSHKKEVWIYEGYSEV